MHACVRVCAGGWAGVCAYVYVRACACTRVSAVVDGCLVMLTDVTG